MLRALCEHSLVLSCAGCSSSNSFFFCAFKGELHWGIDETAAQLERVLNLYKSGEYLQNTTWTPKAGKEVFLDTLRLCPYFEVWKGRCAENEAQWPLKSCAWSSVVCFLLPGCLLKAFSLNATAGRAQVWAGCNGDKEMLLLSTADV